MTPASPLADPRLTGSTMPSKPASVLAVQTPPFLAAIRTLEDVRSYTDPTERAEAATVYLARLHEKEQEALAIRNEALRVAPYSAPQLAARTGVSVATVKAARRSR